MDVEEELKRARRARRRRERKRDAVGEKGEAGGGKEVRVCVARVGV